MKISVCGKGGSGKSTIVALLAGELARRVRRVVVVDSDESNSGLHRLLGLERPPRALLELVGGKKNVQPALRAKARGGDDEAEVSVLADEEVRLADLPAGYCEEQNGTALVRVGKIHQALEGCACPMGVLSREFLKKLRTADDEVVLIDMEAGIEHFGRGVETSVDAVIVVVEPSLESLDLAASVRRLAVESGANFLGGVVNKAASEEIVSQLAAALKERDIPLLGVIGRHEALALAGLSGEAVSLPEAQREAASVTDAILRGVRGEA